MLGKKSLFGGFIGLFFFAIIVFFIIYFLTPEISIKFFGIAFNSDAYLESSLEDAIISAGASPEEAAAMIGEDGSAVISALLDKAGDNLGRLASYLASDEGQSMISQGAEYVRSGAGDLVGYIESQEDFS